MLVSNSDPVGNNFIVLCSGLLIQHCGVWGVEDLGENPGLIDGYIQMKPSSERVPLRSRFNFTAVSGGIRSVDPPNSFGGHGFANNSTNYSLELSILWSLYAIRSRHSFDF